MFNFESAILHHLERNRNGIDRWNLFSKLKKDLKVEFEKNVKKLIDDQKVNKKRGLLFLKEHDPDNRKEDILHLIETKQPLCPTTLIEYGLDRGISELTTMSIIDSLRSDNLIHYCNDLKLMLTLQIPQNKYTEAVFTCRRCDYEFDEKILKLPIPQNSSTEAVFPCKRSDYDFDEKILKLPMPQNSSTEAVFPCKRSDYDFDEKFTKLPAPLFCDEVEFESRSSEVEQECQTDDGITTKNYTNTETQTNEGKNVSIDTDHENEDCVLIHFGEKKVTVDTYGANSFVMGRVELWKESATTSSVSCSTERNNVDKSTSTESVTKSDASVGTEKKKDEGSLLGCLTSCFP